MSEINVRDYVATEWEKGMHSFDGLEKTLERCRPIVTTAETRVTTSKRTLDVGETVLIPYKIVEVNSKQTGDTVLKQFKLDGPAVNPSKETYTEHKLMDVFEVV